MEMTKGVFWCRSARLWLFFLLMASIFNLWLGASPLTLLPTSLLLATPPPPPDSLFARFTLPAATSSSGSGESLDLR